MCHCSLHNVKSIYSSRLLAAFIILVVLSACDSGPNQSNNVSAQSTESVMPAFELSEYKTAGGITHKRLYASYLYPGEKVNNKQKLNFWTGFSFFRDPWVAAPSATGNRDGLGPLFNTRSCIACHTAGSRAKIDEAGHILPLSLVVRLGSKDP
ncbi:MAG: CxxC motif-containing protein (DUF1111 family), partial [Colwellia sp.]